MDKGKETVKKNPENSVGLVPDTKHQQTCYSSKQQSSMQAEI